jgi:uncharacterized membrane protein YbaN (DUF454 family)
VPAKHIKRIISLTIGWTLILLGVVGLFVPILQGILFILLGLYVLSRESKTARRLLDRLRERYPDAYAKMRLLKDKLRSAWPGQAKSEE